jgi:hypothetical protein
VANLIGSGINQLSTNGMLGNLAFQDKAYVSVDKIGIGTVFTDSGTTNQLLQVSGGGAYISGSVGIGTTNPTYPLHVQGNAIFNGSSYFNSSYSLRQTSTASNNVYTLDVTTSNEFVTSAAIAGVTTVNLSNIPSIPSGYVWRGTIRFPFTSGSVSWFSGTTGYVAKQAGPTITLTTGKTYDTAINIVGGGSTIIVYSIQEGYTT